MTVIGALADEQAARQLAESNAAAAAAAAATAIVSHPLNGMEQSLALIPKPRGSAGDGYCLIQEMGLEADKITYNAIVVRNFHVCNYLNFSDILGHCPRAFIWCRA